ncbi:MULTISPECIES: MmgE/PrpD family protein [Metallosphaera]|uniref:2-methylcitrate dehydratase n=3 Tax=Metallosphaera TaxID=41980 RepID=A4YDF3_METS5|nr:MULTISPECIES: MmgE/PrpD family protein [Metallosphaera]ABP94455.1 2-methylcitrate dehydratase [Metallosphaera sedula DSM 5348]AIM26442.1 2-methylcitrate dehydratase [Metallosphaera sedula]AKV73443.1 2-methylcitrate dehydratase [Metallosphaera sedula]AKV75686.1 2-methylcitrate dehydratase [Metallosphaera sedula]AKV77932.1 2-methylcitrate dehydratase [Metallosphaera sedula]
MELAEVFSEFATSTSYSDLPEKSVHEAKRRVLDSLAVAYASTSSPPAEVVRKAIPSFQGQGLLLGGGNSSPDMAAFYNTLLIRYLDFNDTYLSLEPLHPSDMIGGLLAVNPRLSGKELIRAIVLGYEVSTRLCDSTSLRKKGYDHVNFLQVGSAVALGVALGLNKEQLVNAISITTVPHVALRETRSGSLSMWKAGATAEAVRNSVFAVLLAKAGFTGPSTPFSGKMGFRNVIAPDMSDAPFKSLGTTKILETYIKKYPVEYHAQAAVEAGIKLRKQLMGDITKVTVETYEAGRTILADEGKWDPKNKETADHSLPFIVAVTLLTGKFWLDAYDLVGDPKVTELMKKIEVVENEEYTKVYPSELPTKIVVKTTSGTFSEEVRIPRGHHKNPMSDEEVEEKAMKLGLGKDIVNKIWNLEKMEVKDIVSW